MTRISDESNATVSTFSISSTSSTEIPMFLKRSDSFKESQNTETTTESEKTTDWRSIYVMATLGFLSTVQVGGLVNSIWPYLQLLDPSADETFLGYMNAIRSGGSMLTAPIAGYLSMKIAKIKIPLLFAHFLSFCGLTVYIFMELLPGNRKYAFLAVEILFGMKIGLMGLSRAHVAMSSNEKDRKKAVCIVTVAPLVGMTLGPLFQLLFTMLGYPGFNFLFGTHLNMYTFPAFIGLIGNVIGFIILLTLFEDPFTRLLAMNEPEDWGSQGHGILEVSTVEQAERKLYQLVPFSGRKPIISTKAAVLVCFTTKLVMSSITISKSSIQSPYMMTAFNWSNKEYVRYHSIVAATTGAIGILIHCAYIFMKKLATRLQDRTVVMVGLFAFFSFFLITYPWFFIKDRIVYEEVSKTSINSSHIHSHATGCPIDYDWCATTPAVNKYVYNIAEVLLLGVSTPLLLINLDVIFSKLFTSRKQAGWQGLFVTAGDILNIGGPILATQVYAESGPTYIWMFDLALIASLISVWITSYNYMKAPNNKL